MTKTRQHRYKGQQYVMTIEVSREEGEWLAFAKELKSALGVSNRDKNVAIRGAKANGLLTLSGQMRRDLYSPGSKGAGFDSIVFLIEEKE